jgi:hypothetical protein
VIRGTEKWQIFSMLFEMIENQQIFAIHRIYSTKSFNFNLFISSSKFANFMDYAIALIMKFIAKRAGIIRHYPKLV